MVFTNIKTPFNKKFLSNKKDDIDFLKDKPVRIAKRISELGIASRREAEEMIKGKMVLINEKTANLSDEVTYNDKIKINNKEVKNVFIKPKLFLMHKPVGYIVSNKDPEGRKTIFDLIPSKLGRLISIGRLDYNTEGLILLTNNGEMARYFELPINKIKRVYRVRVLGKLDLEKLASLRNGIAIDGIRYDKIIAIPEKYGEMANSWLKVIIFEGKNLEIRKIMMHCGLQVVRLIRIQYGDYRLMDIPKGGIIETRLLPKFELFLNKEEKKANDVQKDNNFKSYNQRRHFDTDKQKEQQFRYKKDNNYKRKEGFDNKFKRVKNKSFK